MLLLYVHAQVANADVRANAACLFLDTFPLQMTDSTREERDVMLQKQFDILKVSAHHAVRPCFKGALKRRLIDYLINQLILPVLIHPYMCILSSYLKYTYIHVHTLLCMYVHIYVQYIHVYIYIRTVLVSYVCLCIVGVTGGSQCDSAYIGSCRSITCA